MNPSAPSTPTPLGDAARLSRAKLLNPDAVSLYGGITADRPVLVILAAGKGTRFGAEPKCVQPVRGIPLARHSIDAFRRVCAAPVICLVGYRREEVAAALGPDNLYVGSENPAGGTALAAYEAFSVPGLGEANPLLIITMGDRIVTPAVFRRLCETHYAGGREADLTFLTAVYEPPKNQGKGRVVRDARQRVARIIEQRDIDALEAGAERQALLSLTEGNCPLYAIRAAQLRPRLEALTNANAQSQYYLTDIVEAIGRGGGDIRTITTAVGEPDYDLLCADVTRPADLALLEGILNTAPHLFADSPNKRGVRSAECGINPPRSALRTPHLNSGDPKKILSPGMASAGEPLLPEVERAARNIESGRPAVQVAAIARQLEELLTMAARDRLGFDPGQPVAIGISGGRLRIAFMHPDMGRFFGPAWQMPTGAGESAGDEQIVVLAQSAADRRIHLQPTLMKYRESVNSIPADNAVMYPGEEVFDWHTYEEFGTRMSEYLLLSLGYFADEELERRKEKGQPLPPSSQWVSSNMRRPFSLVGNAIASMRTLRKGSLGAKVQSYLGRDGFRGLRLISTGNIPQGGFSSSSAVTVATKNAINALFDLNIPPDLLVHLACQAEYGTGVRAGSLDQATEQKGRAREGTLISSNPRDNYRILGTYPVPADRFQVIFPYSVERDRAAWRWSGGAYAESPAPGRLTASEFRKMTGKSAELAALLVRLPLDTDFFKRLEADLVEDGLLNLENRAWIASVLRQLPLRITQLELRERLAANRQWYVEQLMEIDRLEAQAAARQADATFASLLTGWRDPVLRRADAAGNRIEETGAPLRAMVAYLFAEVARNFYLIHHPAEWIEWVTRSQRGDCGFEIEPERLPGREALASALPWEAGVSGPELMDQWLARFGARPFDFNSGLDDASLRPEAPPDFARLEGASFFRGLALIDLAEAMLKRAFGRDAVAVRVNAAGQGDYFQTHVDVQKADVEDVKGFLQRAFYRRFGLAPEPEFVAVHPGGGAAGARLSRFDALPELVRRLAGK